MYQVVIDDIIAVLNGQPQKFELKLWWTILGRDCDIRHFWTFEKSYFENKSQLNVAILQNV
jgi:hypothetical protein